MAVFSLYTETPEFYNDICDEIRLFYDVRRIEQADGGCPEGVALRHTFSSSGGTMRSRAELFVDSRRVAAEELEAAAPEGGALELKKHTKRIVKLSAYRALAAHTGKRPPWGALTGIRPSKLARESIEELGEARARALFENEFLVRKDKADLAFGIAANQRPYLDTGGNANIDIYVGIPFCPSRCAYCSFVSRDIARAASLKGEYLASLIEEIRAAGGLREKYSVRSIYVGGGTPTSLNEGELDALLEEIGKAFGPSSEYTVEAGRPDSITEAKLIVLKSHGATRVSVNTQTTKRRTLELIGREHGVESFYKAFGMVRKVGFKSVNTDVILGLPGEDAADVEKTIEDVMALGAENITAHTLAIKRASRFAEENSGAFCGAEEISAMSGGAHRLLSGRGYLPYYLYRQKYMNGNLENTGYAKEGHVCLYNIDNMEETTSIAAFGAGGISKRIFTAERRIERSANVKDVVHYVHRVGEMIKRKRDLFYE